MGVFAGHSVGGIWPAEEWLFVLLLWLFVLLLPDAEPALARGLLFSPEAACLPPVRCWQRRSY